MSSGAMTPAEGVASLDRLRQVRHNTTPYPREETPTMRLFSVMLVTFAMAAVACGAPQVTSTNSTDEVADQGQAPCPEGSARVNRAGEQLMVSVTEAFSGARDGDRVSLCPGRSLHDATLVLSKVNDVVISGDKTSLVAKGDFPVVQLKESTQVVLEGVRVVHEVGEWCAHGCVEIYNSSQMTVRDSELDGSGYFGIVTSAVTDSEFTDNVFHNCHFGFSTWDSSGLTLKRNIFRDNRGANIEDSAGSSFANDIKAHNEFGPLKPAAPKPDAP